MLRRAITVASSSVAGCLANAAGPYRSLESPTPLASSSVMPRCAVRCVASYPAPKARNRTRAMKKHYNYLTAERLVATPRRRLTRNALRNRDDVGLRKHRSYREAMLRDIEEKIHFVSPEVKKFIFFPRAREGATKRFFRGNRVLPTRTFTRIYVDIIDRLTSRENRAKLVELMKAAGVRPPTAEVFRKYSSKKTGKLTVPLVYSQWMQRYFGLLGRKYLAVRDMPRTDAGHLDLSTLSLSVHQAYILLHFDDESKVPSLLGWSRNLGPLHPESEFEESRHGQASQLSFLAESRREVLLWGQRHIVDALAPLSVAEQQSIVETALSHFESRMAKLSHQLEFAAKVMLAINSLPEVRAMQTPSKVFITEKELQTLLEQKGVAFPPSPYSLKDWRALSTEEQQQYYCFKKKAEARSGSGLHLYLRYCTRDYGLPRVEAPKRFARLSDEQQAALNFPFYFPITPKNPTVAAFKHFYIEMCERYGLARSNGSVNHGNRLFEASMRRKWRAMPAEERQRFFHDGVMAAFPLLPKGGPSGGTPSEADGVVAAELLPAVPPLKTASQDVLQLAKKAERRSASARRRGVRRRTPRRGKDGRAPKKNGIRRVTVSGRRGMFLYSAHASVKGSAAAHPSVKASTDAAKPLGGRADATSATVFLV